MERSIHTPLLIGAVAGTNEPLFLEPDDRLRHLHIIGQTGTGKTTLLLSLIAQDMQAGAGLALLDPHGDLAHDALAYLPHCRANDLVYFDPSERNRVVGLNVLDDVPPEIRPRTAENILSSFIHIWGETSVGPQSQMLLRNSLRALMDAGNASFLGLPRLLNNDDYRARIVHRIRDPHVADYWNNTFAAYSRDQRGHIIAPLQNKLDALVGGPLRAIIGQPKSTIHIPRIMDERRVFIARISEGQLGEGPAYLIGALLTTAFATAAFARAEKPKELRTPFALYADEFQHFATPAFTSIWTGARKYNLALCTAHQFFAQVDEKNASLKDAILGNVGSLVSFRVGADDAEHIARHIRLGLVDAGTQHLHVDAGQLQTLPNYTSIARILLQGSPSRPIDLSMYPSPPIINHRPHRAITHSQEKFGRDRKSVEAAIDRFLHGSH